jgi:hypothetical protein
MEKPQKRINPENNRLLSEPFRIDLFIKVFSTTEGTDNFRDLYSRTAHHNSGLGQCRISKVREFFLEVYKEHYYINTE